jgi:L-rhamnose mutarotase
MPPSGPRCSTRSARRRRDYSIFIRGSDLFAYLEVEDFAAFRAFMAAAPVNTRWQAEMAELIDPLTDPATGFHQRLEEIFHLA